MSEDVSLALNKGMTYENNVFPRNDISTKAIAKRGVVVNG